MILLALAVLAATPTTLNTVVTTAQPGDTIKLVAGSYPVLTIKKRNWSPALTVDATDATIVGVSIHTSSGINWVGGNIVGVIAPGDLARGSGFTADWDSSNISVTGVHFRDLRQGIGFDRVTGGKIVGNWFTAMTSDGIDVALSRNVVIDRNTCTDFRPLPGAHPDCIQLWSRPVVPPTADVTITNNSAVGTMQGITLSNHIRYGVDDGGFDRIVMRGNTILNVFAGGIGMGECRNCIVRDNNINSLPNYVNKAQLYILGGSVFQCGNVVPMTKQGTPPCTASAGP